MPPKSCSWARVDAEQPNARVVTFEDFEIMAPKIHVSHAYSLRSHINRGMVSGGTPLGRRDFWQPYPI